MSKIMKLTMCWKIQTIFTKVFSLHMSLKKETILLDILLIRTGNNIEATVYRKRTNSNIFF